MIWKRFQVMYTVLAKTLVYPFYRQNAGLLWIAGLLAGGFMRESDHVALATYAVSSVTVLALYVAIWLLYTLLATRFAVSMINRYDVLLHLRLFSPINRWAGLGTSQLLLMGPALGYAWFVIRIARQEKQVWAIATIGGSLLLIWAAGISWYEYALRHPNPVSRWATWVNRIRRYVRTPYSLFYLRYLLNEQGTLFWRTKLGTGLVWIGILKLYATDHYQINLFRTPDYDLRLIGLGGLLVGLGHATVVYEQYRFEHRWLPIYRNMPVPDWRRWAGYVGQFALLLLPEALLLLYHLPADQPLWRTIGAWAFGVSLLSVQQGLLFRVHRTPDRSMTVVYIMLIAYFLFVMFRIPLWGLATANLLASGWLFSQYYWTSAWEGE
ncbi:hypothetical protein [Fibrella forsythiae]|uniref:ABC transporter permease n=1 Tax=Fibrella forsythiae TaxID=2817061 RepID=A0ABS3JJP8_9BACT|nr:hypothetical protein [Fibrella forsythiae]MBO0950231.1 hypothetical protein [Fibrella forsythiae]